MAWNNMKPRADLYSVLMLEMGVDDVRVLELYDVEADYLLEMRPIYGLIYLTVRNNEIEEDNDDHARTDPNNEIEEDNDDHACTDPIEGIFFARQLNKNTCATYATLSVLMNSPEVNIGPHLSNLKEFTEDFTPELKGLMIDEHTFIRRAHNRVVAVAGEDQRVFDFTCYLPVGNELFEISGRRNRTVRLGQLMADEEREVAWLRMVSPILEEQEKKDFDSGIDFCLMAVVDRH